MDSPRLHYGASGRGVYRGHLDGGRFFQEEVKNTWRHSANTVIYDVIAENPDADEKQLRKLLRDAYPFGQRAMHPYKIWCDAVKKALKLRFVVKPGQQLEITEGLFKQQ